MAAPKVTYRRDLNSLTILFDGLPHVRFALEKFIGFQSWLWAHRRAPFERKLNGKPIFEVELYFSDAKPIRMVYYDRKTWEDVLSALDSGIYNLPLCLIGKLR